MTAAEEKKRRSSLESDGNWNRLTIAALLHPMNTISRKLYSPRLIIFHDTIGCYSLTLME